MTIMTELLNGIPRVDPTAEPAVMLRVWSPASSRPALGSAVHRHVMAPLDGPLMRLTRGRLHFGKGTIPLVVSAVDRSQVRNSARRAAWLLHRR